MMNTLQNIIKEIKQESHLELVNKQFSNEIILNQSIQSSILGEITFFKIDFRNVNLIGSHMVACTFKNCLFDNVMLIKCQFWNCTFLECQIKESNLTRAEFNSSTFKNCEFLNSDLTASDFMDFEFIETKFKNSKLDLILVKDVKVWKSDKWIQIKDFSSFKTLLIDNELGLISQSSLFLLILLSK